MSKGFLLLEIIQFSSQHYKTQKTYLAFKSGEANFTTPVSQPPNKVTESRYFPLAENIQISVFQNPQDRKIGYFSLPLAKLYEFPKRRHIVKVNCAWMDLQNGNEVSPGISAVVKLGIVYMKDATANLNILVKKADLKRDTQAIGKMDPFVECVVGNVTSKTQIKQQAGKQPVWNQKLLYTLQSIPQTIIFWVKDKDVASDDIVGFAILNPHESKIFTPQKQNKQWVLELLYKEQKAGTIFLETSFSINT